MKIIWSPQAREDLRGIFLYIAEDNPHTAAAFQSQLKGGIVFLKENPHIGRPGRVPGTRELIIANTPSTVPYRVRGDRLEILRIYHGARKWPNSF